MSGTSGWNRAWLACVVAALVVAGCGSDSDSGSGSGSGSGDDRAASGDRARSNSTTTAERTTTSTLPPAADGADFAACADGNCEVEVSRPVDIPLTGQGGGITILSVDELLGDGFAFSTTSNGGGSRSGELRGACTATLYPNGVSTVCSVGGDPPAPATDPGVLSVQLMGAADGAVVVRLTSR